MAALLLVITTNLQSVLSTGTTTARWSQLVGFRQGIRPIISLRIVSLPIFLAIAGCAVLYFVLVAVDVWVVRDKSGTTKLYKIVAFYRCQRGGSWTETAQNKFERMAMSDAFE